MTKGKRAFEKKYADLDYLAAIDIFLYRDWPKADELIGKAELLRVNSANSTFSLGSPVELKRFYERLQTVNKLQKTVAPSFIRPVGKPLPYALQYLHVREFRGIKKLTISDLPLDAQWIFLTGQNGFGKSSVLQAIAVGLWGLRDETPGSRKWVESPTTIQCLFGNNQKALFYRDIDYQRHNNSLEDAVQGNMHGRLAAYGSSRLHTSPMATISPDDPRQATLYHLFNNDGELLDVEQWLILLNGYQKPEFDYVVELLKALIPSLHSIEVNFPSVVYLEEDDAGIPYSEGVSFNQLAAGFRNIIALVCDILRRLTTDNEPHKIESHNGQSRFLSVAGIVIIDEFELHFHPWYQRQLPGILSELFPNVQFIVSTHSPIPLLGAPKENVVLTVHRTEETGITIERSSVDFSKLLPTAILTSPIFGFEDIIPESAESPADIGTAARYDDELLIQQLKEEYGILAPASI